MKKLEQIAAKLDGVDLFEKNLIGIVQQINCQVEQIISSGRVDN